MNKHDTFEIYKHTYTYNIYGSGGIDGAHLYKPYKSTPNISPEINHPS